jgi:hypothetical protein
MSKRKVLFIGGGIVAFMYSEAAAIYFLAGVSKWIPITGLTIVYMLWVWATLKGSLNGTRS